MLAEYHRGGGNRPRDDESLDIEDDGSFVLTRTVGGPRVGRFAGALPKPALAALQRLVGAADDLDGRPTGRPPHVIEKVLTPRADIAVVAGSRAGSPAGKLVKRLRELTETLTADAVAALELRIANDARSITLASVGTAPIEVDLSTASLTWTLYGAREDMLAAGEIPAPATDRSPARLEPGWAAELPIDADVKFNPRRTLDVTVELDLYDRPRAVRRARLRAYAGKGWS